jgi:hypothetical protein
MSIALAFVMEAKMDFGGIRMVACFGAILLIQGCAQEESSGPVVVDDGKADSAGPVTAAECEALDNDLAGCQSNAVQCTPPPIDPRFGMAEACCDLDSESYFIACDLLHSVCFDVQQLVVRGGCSELDADESCVPDLDYQTISHGLGCCASDTGVDCRMMCAALDVRLAPCEGSAIECIRTASEIGVEQMEACSTSFGEDSFIIRDLLFTACGEAQQAVEIAAERECPESWDPAECELTLEAEIIAHGLRCCQGRDSEHCNLVRGVAAR